MDIQELDSVDENLDQAKFWINYGYNTETPESDQEIWARIKFFLERAITKIERIEDEHNKAQ